MKYRIIKAHYHEGMFEVEGWFEPGFLRRGEWSVLGWDFECGTPEFKSVTEAEQWIKKREKPPYRGGQVVKVIE